MKQCIYCGAELEDDARACNNCGRPVPDMPEKVEKAEEAVSAEPVEKPSAPQPDPSERQELPTWEHWGQQPQQDPWGDQEAPRQDPWGHQETPRQDHWGQQPQQDPWGRQQSQWGQQQDPQAPWGGPQQGNDPNYPGSNGPIPGYGGPYAGYNGQQNIPKRYHMFAVWSMLFGIMSIFLNGFVFIPSILAIVFAVIAIVKIHKDPQQYLGTGMAIIGLVLGVAFLIVYGYVFRMVFQAVQNPETLEQLQNYLQEIGAGRK